MIEKARILISISLFLIISTVIFHFVAIGHDRWKISEHRKLNNKTIFIGIFHRCENRQINIIPNSPKIYPICDENKYCFYGNTNCSNLEQVNSIEDMQSWCNIPNNPSNCIYSSITKGLIACTIIASCTLSLSLLLIFSHILINQFKYKIHMYISIITIILLFLGFLFILITLSLLGSTLSYDLYQYRYNLDYRLASPNTSSKDVLKKEILDQAYRDYDTRLDWAGDFEIVALILSSFTLVTQIIYLVFIYRNRIG